MGWFGRVLRFAADPVGNAYIQQVQLAQAQQQAQVAQQHAPQQLAQQQGQLAPQGFFGNLLGSIGQPLGGAIGGLFGNPHLGGQIGGGIGQFGRLLPFAADPVMNAYAQQAERESDQAEKAAELGRR